MQKEPYAVNRNEKVTKAVVQGIFRRVCCISVLALGDLPPFGKYNL